MKSDLFSTLMLLIDYPLKASHVIELIRDLPLVLSSFTKPPKYILRIIAITLDDLKTEGMLNTTSGRVVLIYVTD